MRFLAVTALSALLLTGPAWAGDNGLFGYAEEQHSSLAVFVKWTGMLERAAAADTDRRAPVVANCLPAVGPLCGIEGWRAELKALATVPAADLLAAVNKVINRAPYITDPVNWGVPDYWETVSEFLARDGDCEDYAIAKYVTLKQLGVPPQTMRIVVVQDTNLGVPHAVLEVERDGTRWILDNQVGVVLADKAIHHYRPIYSINEEAWWLHGDPPS